MKKLIALLLFTGFLFSSNGKLTGTITQKSDNAPAVGVNIMITDTYLGAASGQDGRFVILNIPPGTYSVRVDAIGFAPVVLQNVRITTSQTTEINIKLDESVVEGQEVTVVAERPLIQKDLTASQRVTTAKEIADMPVESFLGVLSTHAGVNKSADGALHVRGGRSNEVGYYIGGVSMSNPFFTNSLAVGLSNKALEEMKLVSGAFNAEYCNAMSGVVNVKVKDGGKDYQGSLSYYAGDYNSNAEDIFPNISDQSFTANTTLDAFVSGPVIPGLGDKLTFNISVMRNQSEGLLNGIREHSPGDFA